MHSDTKIQHENASGSNPGSLALGSTKKFSTPVKITQTRRVQCSQHALSQLKLVFPGAIVTYYLGTLNDFWNILHGSGGSWFKLAGFGASALGFTTVILFLYILLMPWITGEEPNYEMWRDSGTLSSVIPVLTGSIVVGWLLAVGTLGQGSPLGYVRSTIGVSAFYALTFGLLGLIPVPRVKTRKAPS